MGSRMLLANYFCKFRFGTLSLSYGDVDGRSGLLAVKATALHDELIVVAVFSRALADGLWCAEGELVRRTSGIEDGLVCLCHRLLGRVLWQQADRSLLIGVLYQEAVEFLLCGGYSGSTHTITIHNCSFGERLLEGLR